MQLTKQEEIDLLMEAQAKFFEVIELLEAACEGDLNAEVYLIAPLKIFASRGHGFLSHDLNIDDLIERCK